MLKNTISLNEKMSSEGLRARNRTRIMKLVLNQPGIDRSRLAEKTGLSNPPVTRIVQELLEANILKDVGQLDTPTGRGRRRTGLQINGAGGYVIGISFLAFNSSVLLTDISGRIIDETKLDPGNMAESAAVLDNTAQAIRQLLEKHSIDRNRVFGVGVSVAGYLDATGASLDSSPYLGWPRFNIQGSLARRLNMPVMVENVNRCIAHAQIRPGANPGFDELILIRASLGLGSAIISNGEIHRGHDNKAGFIGHIPVDPSGLKCSCGATGCLNTIASGWAVLHKLGKVPSDTEGRSDLKSQQVQLKRVLDDATQGDEASRTALWKAGASLARHCLGVIHVVAPEAVILTGPLGRSAFYCDAFRETLKNHNVGVLVETAHDRDIANPADAAASLALMNHVYSANFEVPTLSARTDDRGEVLPGASIL